MTRALAILIASGIAGALLWAASRVHRDTTAGFWAEIGILAIAGLVVATGRLTGSGVSGRMRTTLTVLIFGFLPGLVAGGWILLASQPNGSSLQHHVMSWSQDIQLDSVVKTLVVYAPVIAFGLGLLLGLAFERIAIPAVSTEFAQPPQPVPSSELPTSLDARRAPASAPAPVEGKQAATG